MHKSELKLITAAVIGLLLSLVCILVLNKAGATSNLVASPVDASLSLKTLSNSSVGLNLTNVNKENTISSFSLRLYYPLTPGQTISFHPNPDLLGNGWLFPVNKITIDTANSRVAIDISGIDTNVGGYLLNQVVELGTINFAGKIGEISSLTISLDKSQTKILDKNASQLNYKFVN